MYRSGMKHTVELDDDIFLLLQKEARPLVDDVNDVLRRLLNPALAGKAPVSEPKKSPGNLAKLVDAGLIKPGDRLTHQRKRSGQTFHATVTADGRTELDDGRSFQGPSPALRAFVGTQIDGNANWTHDASGKTLRTLIASLA